jgi:hypothetical protein
MATSKPWLAYGSASDHQSRYVSLWWRERRPDPHNLDSFWDEFSKRESGQSAGLYVIEGSHDAHRERSVLYVGVALGPDQPRGQKLATRLGQSLGRVFWSEQDRVHVYSDVWDLVVRWAPMAAELVKSVEGLLIVSHAPPFNAQEVRMDRPEHDADLVILNAGAKGALLPCVAGAYYCNSKNVWPRTPTGT